MSVDQVFSHMKWTDWIRDALGITIEFPIIAGTESIAHTLGLIHPGKGTNTVRAVFIVDPKSAIRAILYYPQELGRNMDEIVRMIRGFQVSEANRGCHPGELAGERTDRGSRHPSSTNGPGLGFQADRWRRLLRLVVLSQEALEWKEVHDDQPANAG